MYGLENTSGNEWADQLVLAVKDTFNRLYDEFATFNGLIPRFHHPLHRLLLKLVSGENISVV